MIFNSDNRKSVSLKKISSMLIPYVSLFDHGCVITKNGNLIQIIKLKGFASDESLSERLRNTIKELNRDDVALWIHTVRKKVNVSLKWYETGDFSDELHDNYVHNNSTFINYVNEVYISIVALSPQTNFNKSIFDFINNTFNVASKDSRKPFDKINENLNKVSDIFLNNLKDFDAHKLYSNEEDSSLLTFLYFLVTFQSKQTNLSIYEISDYLSYQSQIAFGINAFEIHNDNHKKVGAVIGIKEHKKVLNNVYINELMNVNFEFLITEVIHFTTNENGKKSFENQNYLLQVSNEENFKNLSFFTEISSSSSNKIEFCYHNIQIIPLASNLELLENNIKSIFSIFSNMGLAFLRYDIALEKMLWFRLPGNSPLIPKKRINHLNNICDFTEIYGYFSGLTKDVVWINPLTVFFSIDECIHIFNFHYKSKSGHTIIISQSDHQSSMQRTIFRNFLISESRKNKVKVLILDSNCRSEIFVRALNGNYINSETIKMNVLSINMSDPLSNILQSVLNNKINASNIKLLTEKIISSNSSVEEVIQLLKNIDESLIECFSSDILSEDEAIDWKNNVVGINIDNIIKNSKNSLLKLYYLIYKFLSNVENKPFIIAFESIENFTNLFSEQIIQKLLSDITNMNGIMILPINSNAKQFKDLKHIIDHHITTQFFLPNFLTNDQHLEQFDLIKSNIDEINYIMDYDKCVFLKQNKNSIVLKFSMDTMKEKYILYSNEKTIKLANESIDESGKDAKNWIPVYLKKCEQQ